jgi:hypothetical protein
MVQRYIRLKLRAGEIDKDHFAWSEFRLAFDGEIVEVRSHKGQHFLMVSGAISRIPFHGIAKDALAPVREGGEKNPLA